MSKVITGFHSIEEKIKAFSKVQETQNVRIFYSKIGPRVKKILEFAKKSNIKASQVDEKVLNQMVSDLDVSLQDHRGIVLEIENLKEENLNNVDFDSWIKEHKNDENSTVVILDRITDPHNVGAILRSCDQFGINLVIIPEHNSANNILENEVIGRTSAGASAWVPFTIVNNLVSVVEKLKESDFWIYGADAGGENLTTVKFAKKSVLIMGSEGSGIAELLRKNCDKIVSIPTVGKIDSLNVSVATGILLYELYKR